MYFYSKQFGTSTLYTVKQQDKIESPLPNICRKFSVYIYIYKMYVRYSNSPTIKNT